MDVLKDMNQAFYWYTLAAHKHLAEAQYNLGLCYYLGEGVAKDRKTAPNWIVLSARQNFKDAINFLHQIGHKK